MRRSLVREYLEALLIAVLFATFARTYVAQAFKIPTGSMEENLLIGDHILVNKFVYSPLRSAAERWLLPHRAVRRGDVVVFEVARVPDRRGGGGIVPADRRPEAPREDFVKRIVGLPGDRIEVRISEKHTDGALACVLESGAHVVSVTPQRASLESVFLSAVEDGALEAASEREAEGSR